VTPPAGLDGISILPVLRGEPTKVKRNPMIWVYPEYGGQVAVRIGDFKVMRTAIKSKNPGEWEVYDVANDRNETTDLAASQPRLIKKAISILERQWDDSNTRYSMSKAKALE
jgi:arylsulfatase A-like enzyme